ncbi:beta-ketoacyl synthase N-terminal-like domain-containing protein [Archangium lipolyticum]|uniref:beta-ketoacyl synthase N-terminal-like domain-containing protein n=1 Tax=Archangium lipolyticum TaxID=2970465 RepID=UPI002149FD43|nr:beta-ketoacyl synthase N-terminal-like domain-containing protein [Archangium lipolyticum]
MKAAVTGWAWRTPLGVTVEQGVARLLAGERAARPAVGIEAEAYACRLVAPVGVQPARSREGRFLRRMGRFTLEVAREAAEQAGVQGGDRVGLFAGFGGLRAHWEEMMPALERQEPDGREAWKRGLAGLHPFWMLQHLSNNAHALVSVALKARGEGMTFGGANAGAQALASAQRALVAGAVDVAIVLTEDTLLEPEVLVELGASGAANRAGLEALEAPYSVRSAGFVPGEAAAAVVLEPVERAGTRALAWAEAADGADGSKGAPRVETLARVAASLVTPGIQVIDGAGRADVTFDAAEREALARIVPEEAFLTATAAAMGQLGASAPVVQLIALASCLRRGVVPPVAGLSEPGPGPLRLVMKAEETTAREALVLSAGAPGLVGAVRVEVP